MEETNVNNLNGIPNFGHGFGTEVPEEAELSVAEQSHEEENMDTPAQEDVAGEDSAEEADDTLESGGEDVQFTD